MTAKRRGPSCSTVRMVKVYDNMLHMMETQRTVMGHAQVIVNGDYARLPEDDIVVRNVSEGADKESHLRRVPTALL